jgi:serine/threonine-protein kinase
MAVVFRARDQRLDRLVALKILAPALAADEGFRRRFIAESRAAAAVDDPHIIPVYEAGEADGVLFIAMRFVAGGDLRGVLAREGPLRPGRAAGFISPVASALDAAHRAGLVHRDVKPANVLVDARGDRPDHVYLSDFGVSKGAKSSVSLTGTGQYLGTPEYSAPEQVQGRAVDGRTDQYALACVAWELLTGSAPFERDQGLAVLLAHISEPPPSLSEYRPELGSADQVLAKALAKVPEERYLSCGEFADALREALGVQPYTSHESAAPGHPRTVLSTGRLNEVAPDAVGPGDAGSPAGTPASAYQRTADHISRGRWQAAADELNPIQEIDPAHKDLGQLADRARYELAPRGADPSPAARQPMVTTGYEVNAVAFSPDGTRLALARNGRRASITDLAGREQLRIRHDLMSGFILCVAFDREGVRLATGSDDKTARIWDTATGSQLRKLAHDGTVFGVAFSPDGHLLATASDDKTARIWDTATGSQLRKLAHDGTVFGVAFSPDGHLLATASDDKTARIWDTATGSQLRKLAHDGTVFGVAFSPDGHLLATASDDKTAGIWDTATGSRLRKLAHGGRVRGVAFSPDGHLLATAGADNTARIWDTATGSRLRKLAHGGRVRGVAFSPDGHLLATASDDKTTRLWRIIENHNA